MTIPRWRPLPSLVALDARVRGVSHEARGVFMLLVCASTVDGVVRFAGPVSRAVDALAGEGAGSKLDELVDAQLVEIDVEGELVLPDVPRWQAEHAPRSVAEGLERRATPQAERRPAEASPAPSTLDRRTASKRLSVQWGRRNLRTPEDRERWLNSESGRSYLETSGISLALATAIATGCQHPVSSDASTPPAVVSAGASSDASTPSAAVLPRSPSPEGEERSAYKNTPNPARTSDASEPSARASARQQAAASADTHGVSTDSGEGGDCSSVEYLFRLASDSDGRFVTSGSPDQQEAVAAVFRRSGLSSETLLRGLRRPSEALVGVDMVTSRDLVSVTMLAGRRASDGAFPCTLAHSLVAWVRAQSEPKVSAELANAVRAAEETRAYIAPLQEHAKRAKESVKAAVASGWKPPALVVAGAEVSNG